MSRRSFMCAAAGAGLAGVCTRPVVPVRARVLERRVVSHEAQYYHGWPTLARRRNGRLVLVYSGGREEHVCPFGRVEEMVSDDGGRNWSWPRVLLDGGIDDRDAGVIETARGSLLVTTFTSLAYQKTLESAAAARNSGDAAAWAPDRLRRWQAAHDRLTPEQRRSELGQWMIRSTDGGATWSARYPTVVNSPHGPIQLRDGRLLYPGKELWTGEGRVGVCESLDDGQTWRWLSEIPARPGDTTTGYHELHGVESAPGRIVVQIRNHNKANAGETLQTESMDGGKRWTLPHGIDVWGLPSFLTQLRSGQLLMTYGYRRAPFGNQARLSGDGGQTWSEAVVISGDGDSGDLGYPSTVQLEDESLLTVWYERLKSSPRAVLRQSRWVIET